MVNDRNVILIVVDALRAKSVGIYGQHPSPSPTLDMLAREGALFENAFTSTVTTDPTITAIMSGRYPVRNGLVNNEAKITPQEINNISKVPLIAEHLKKYGYHTGAIDWLSRWFERGFDDYSGSLITGQKQRDEATKMDIVYKYMRIIDLVSLHLIKRDFLNRIYYTLRYDKLPYDPADMVINGAINFVDKNKNRNFFLYVHLWDTHYPYVLPKTAKSILFDSIHSRYLANLSSIDSQIKRLVQFLKKKKLLDKTLLVITGDHGESMTEHGIYISHRGLYDETVKVPLIFHGPGFTKAKITNLVQNIDIAPTILSFVGMDYNKDDFDGQNLIPLIKKTETDKRNLVYFEDLTPGEYKIRKNVRRRGIRTAKYKYIQSFYGEKQFLFSVRPKIDKLAMKEELYDLGKDPTEKNNIVNQKPELKEQLQRQLDKFIKRFDRNVFDKKEKSNLLSKKIGIKKKSYKEEQVLKKFRKMGYW